VNDNGIDIGNDSVTIEFPRDTRSRILQEILKGGQGEENKRQCISIHKLVTIFEI